ncbi:pentapeptide repeat-containing protein [Trichocoleus sp. ST-U3]
MAIKEHLEQVQKGLETWNVWRQTISGRPDFSNANLSKARLNGELEKDGMKLWTYMNLSKADFSGANLTGADLTGADLYQANLSGADLSGADLTGANLTEANLTEANLTGASGVNLSGVNKFSGTIMPDGTVWEK